MPRKLIYAGAIMVLITGAAVAQNGVDVPSQSSVGIPFKDAAQPPTSQQTEKQKATDKAYDAAIHKIPDKKGSTDPWADVRSGPSATKNKHQ
jgi:hypothetical protein